MGDESIQQSAGRLIKKGTSYVGVCR